MFEMADGVVVAQREQLLPLGVSRVPSAEGGALLVGQHHVVLGVVERCTGPVLLLGIAARTGVGNQTT